MTVTTNYKENVGKLTDQAIGVSALTHVFSQEIYQPEIRKMLSKVGVKSNDKYECRTNNYDARLRVLTKRAIDFGFKRTMNGMKNWAVIRQLLSGQKFNSTFLSKMVIKSPQLKKHLDSTSFQMTNLLSNVLRSIMKDDCKVVFNSSDIKVPGLSKRE